MRAEPAVLVIFGATGDLTGRKLVPAIYKLFIDKMLHENFAIIGFARRENTDEEFRAQMHTAVSTFGGDVPIDDALWRRFSARLFYHRGSFDDAEGFRSLRQRLDAMAALENRPRNSLFYLATQPQHFTVIVNQLHQAGLNRNGPEGWSRVIIEKPFGHDLQSARALNEQIRKTFSEEQIYRIDHYLGKEQVQNLLVLRFANSIYEPIWNNKYIDHVQITVGETIGIENRAAYYEQSGALRDIMQNHMMHLLSLVAMEPPRSLQSEAIRDEKVQVIRSLRPIPADCVANNVVRAQYGAGVIRGESVCGYREEPGVAADSTRETYMAFKTCIDNWRWAGVPFYLRTGKRLTSRVTEIGIHFKPVPKVLFNADAKVDLPANSLAIRIQPNEGISLQFQLKVPGTTMRIEPLMMDFGYKESFGRAPAEAYERLLLDAALGDSTLFTRSDEVEASWAFFAPIIDNCLKNKELLVQYPAGSWGPKEAERLIGNDGRRWMLTRRPVHPTAVEVH